MDHYIIDLAPGTGIKGKILVLTRYEPGSEEMASYDVYRDGVLLGTIQPAIGECGDIVWVSDDLPNNELVRRVGEEIERQDR